MHGPLITAAELAEVLADVTVLDVRYRMGGPPGLPDFERGHLPGAAYVDLDTDLADPPGRRGRHPLPDPERFAAAMTAAGVRRDRPVVCYDDWGGRAAARCWWLLRYHGHADVRVLDGGWSGWQAGGGVTESGSPSPDPGDFRPDPGHLPVLVADDVLAFEGTLLDARERPRYLGETEPVDPVAGHIPGARNVPTSANLDDTGHLRDAAALAEVYPEGPVAAYCGSGVTAAHDLLALAVLGREGALYAGSWSEWVTDPERPIATG